MNGTLIQYADYLLSKFLNKNKNILYLLSQKISQLHGDATKRNDATTTGERCPFRTLIPSI